MYVFYFIRLNIFLGKGP